ncbi:MAG TPA: hypothetical protein VG322_09205 [Candidatus Acidoferrales bacterium]|jgi:hypothetical protein|nr:hypothetical protein [Candidatus Acidoferrales bacterium]
MHSFRLICRIAAFAAFGILSLLSITVVIVLVQNHILRHRAEELLRDMQTIDLRQTTFADVQPIFQHWRNWGNYDGPCTQSRCAFNISLRPFNTRLNEILLLHKKTFDVASFLRYQPAGVGARIIVLDGRVWGEAIFFGVEIWRPYENGNTFTEFVSGEATSVARTQMLARGRHWNVHPEYSISWPTNLKNEVRFLFTPFADPNDVHRLMALDFSCLTRSKPCLDKKAIMPVALSQVALWSRLSDPPNPECENPDPTLLKQWARDARHVVIAKLGKKGPARGYKPEFHLNERALILQKVLKSSKSSTRPFPPAFGMFEFPGQEIQYQNGDSVILFLKDDNFDDYSIEGCSPLALTQRNLSIVSHGIAEDTRPTGLPDFATGVFSP